MRKFVIPSCFFLALTLWSTTVFAETKARLLQEVIGPNQRLERLHGLPLIISLRQYGVILTPQTILPESNTILYFDLVISNPSADPLPFSIGQVTATASQKQLKILATEEVIAEKRRFYSRKEYKISSEEEKLLAPFVEQKMQMVRDTLLIDQVIAPNSKVAGTIAVAVPFGIEHFTIEVTPGNERHAFAFNVGEF